MVPTNGKCFYPIILVLGKGRFQATAPQETRAEFVILSQAGSSTTDANLLQDSIGVFGHSVDAEQTRTEGLALTNMDGGASDVRSYPLSATTPLAMQGVLVV